MHILLNAIKSDFEVCTDISVKGHLYQAARRSAAQNTELIKAVHTNNPLLCIREYHLFYWHTGLASLNKIWGTAE